MKSQLSWQEYQALESVSSNHVSRQTALVSKLSDLWQMLLSSLATDLRVWKTEDETGSVTWNAYDPVRHRSIRQVSDNELRVWLEQVHLG